MEVLEGGLPSIVEPGFYSLALLMWLCAMKRDGSERTGITNDVPITMTFVIVSSETPLDN